MLVALPAAVVFGVTLYSAISPQYAAFGVLAGILGATALGLIAPYLRRQRSPDQCALRACCGGAFGFCHPARGAGGAAGTRRVDDDRSLLLTGLNQILIGFPGIGKLIRYIPYPVVSGYLSGVGLIIIGSQLPKFAGAPAGIYWLEVLLTPHQCRRCGQNG
jgi:SulP family sulfate permease